MNVLSNIFFQYDQHHLLLCMTTFIFPLLTNPAANNINLF